MPEAVGAPVALRIAIVGAESTGKTMLAAALAARLGEEFGLRCTTVPEVLRGWCEARGRTPRPDEQRGIADAQQAAIDAAARAADVVVCDTTPLMTDVYSTMLFADPSIEPFARAAQAACDATLLTAVDLPWVADGLQRDGPHVQAPVDALVRARLLAWGTPFAVVAGAGTARVEHALDAVRPALAAWLRAGRGPGALAGALAASATGPRLTLACALRGRCELCDQGDLEHRLRRRPDR